ncbi:MAG: MTH1187 family thiamine-binding protein [Chloroflexota bacterium]
MANPIMAEVHIIPLGTATASLSRYIRACIEPLKQAKDVNYQVTAMGTIIQGPLERVLQLVQQMHEVPFTQGARRVVTAINIDDRRDKIPTMTSKVEVVT